MITITEVKTKMREFGYTKQTQISRALGLSNGPINRALKTERASGTLSAALFYLFHCHKLEAKIQELENKNSVLIDLLADKQKAEAN